MRPFSGLGNWDRCCETLVWGMEEGRWRMRCNCDGNASTLKLARFPCALWIFRDAAVLPGTAWLPGQLAQKCGPIAATTLRKTGSVGTLSQLLFEDFCDPESVARKRPCFRARNSASFLGPENGLVFRTEKRPPILRCVDWGRFSASKPRPFSGFGIGAERWAQKRGHFSALEIGPRFQHIAPPGTGAACAWCRSAVGAGDRSPRAPLAALSGCDGDCAGTAPRRAAPPIARSRADMLQCIIDV